ncbi:MAG: cytochrome c [Chlorobium sp.]|nr:MAG: cytochrome c [Chlorobium sp.]
MKKIIYACMVSGIASGFLPTVMSAAVLNGEAVFTRNCSVCHSIYPPPKSAPPVIPLANRYHQKFATKEEGVAHMAAYLKNPDKNQAIDVQAVSRFGLMPALSLPDAELKAVSEWFWEQYNPAMGRGRGMGRGWGMGRGQGQCINQ